MKDFGLMKFHPTSEKLVQVLCNRTDNTNPLFFRIHVAFYWAQLASMMRANLSTIDRGEIPINLYAINLMTSGAGKGLATGFMEEHVCNQFYNVFKEETLPAMAASHLPKIALQRAARNQSDPDDELRRLEIDFEKECGPYLLSFDSGTAAAVKQARTKILLANAGSANLVMDEIGSNFIGNTEILNTFLELYDVGKIKQKLVKHTAENKRHEDIPGRTPANFMGFGTPAMLLDGGKNEDTLMSFLEAGYARRCLFGYSRNHEKRKGMTPREILDAARNGQVNQFTNALSDQLANLATANHCNKLIDVPEDTALLFIEYRLDCQARSEKLAEHDVIRKSELDHRYFKAMKLAGAYAFIDGHSTITEEYFDYAVKVTETSGFALDKILTRDRKHAKLAKYLGDCRTPVTQSDLVEDLPYYRGPAQQKSEMMQLAIAYGYQNNILIKKHYEEGIEFIQGETLQKTNLNEIIVSHSDDIAYRYRNEVAPFEQLHTLTQLNGRHWVNHHLVDGHRCEDSATAGFNTVVLDVEKSVSLEVAKSLLSDYKALYYTTKRHTSEDNRYRIIIPTNYVLSLDGPEYKDFMKNVFNWLPFEVDDCTGQRSRKWLSHNGTYEYVEGDLLDVLPFIPKTSKNETFLQKQIDSAGMDNLERWVLSNSGDGNRNNMLLRYAMILVDGGYAFDDCQTKVNNLNAKLDKPIPLTEIMQTIMVTVSKQIASR